MAKFTTGMSEKDKTKNRWVIYIGAVLVILFFVLICVVKDARTIFPANFLLIAVGIGLAVYPAVQAMGMVKFAEIDPTRIEWLVNEKNKPYVLVEWSDVEWVKKETNGNISFFKASSFCDSLRIDDFSEKDQAELTVLVIKYARQQNIRLVNFSEQALATA